MDQAGIDRMILVMDEIDPKWVLKAIEKYPSRFIGAQSINPLEGIWTRFVGSSRTQVSPRKFVKPV
jgi:hypothetical protein